MVGQLHSCGLAIIMRLILDELNINQVIIVSHEIKIESFVENILRFKKENHISKVE